MMLVFILVLLVFYGVLLFLTARRSVWIPVALHALLLAALIVCNVFEAGHSGGSDAMGNGMARGFLQLFYYAMMAVTSLIFAACLLWWYVKIHGGTAD